MEIFLAVCVSALVFIIGYRAFRKRRIFGRRRLVPLNDIYTNLSDRERLDFEAFCKIFDILGSCYGIDPRQIRPADRLDRFTELDSWHLDAGTEKLEAWLSQEGIDVTKLDKRQTVYDLLIAHRNASARPSTA
ncbi:MAG TPA: hypothetical protein VHP37_29110 [Burkholderiales bacterium]|nr:hypothetical protein [Burkholderiales bacterium]